MTKHSFIAKPNKFAKFAEQARIWPFKTEKIEICCFITSWVENSHFALFKNFPFNL